MSLPSIKEHLMRQLDVLPTAVLGEKINVIGAGAIGSFTVLSLAKMGFENIEVWDDDVIDKVNLNCQFYRWSDLGKPKVVALKEIIKDFANVDLKINQCRYERGELSGIVISAVDSMAVRKNIFEQQRLSINLKAILDPRMSVENASLFKVRPTSLEECEQYKISLYSDEEAVQERCTAKATMYTVEMIAGYTAKLVKDIVTKGECIPYLRWAIKDDDLEIGGRQPEVIEKIVEKKVNILPSILPPYKARLTIGSDHLEFDLRSAISSNQNDILNYLHSEIDRHVRRRRVPVPDPADWASQNMAIAEEFMTGISAPYEPNRNQPPESIEYWPEATETDYGDAEPEAPRF